jgi:hypothetical protein
VEVTSAPPLIQTDQSAIGGSFTPITFENLPIGRNVLATVGLLPGVEGGVAGHFQGSRANRTDYKVDGIAAATTNLGYIRIQPVADLVEEVVVQTSNYSAELGRGTGQVSVTTRAGTNKFHGVLFHYFQNDVLNANGFMPNVYGTQKPVKRYNLFGGTINGPVVLPKIYDGHNRTFFTFAYEGIRPINYQQAVSSVPTSAMRAGDFTGQPVIYDPATTAPNASGSGYVRTPFAGNRIPSARMDPVSLNILKAGFPEANLPGTANNHFNSGSARNPVNTHHESERITGRRLKAQPAEKRDTAGRGKEPAALVRRERLRLAGSIQVRQHFPN